ncbi:MAG TPA: protein kinase, partial [Dokdonella sp.]
MTTLLPDRARGRAELEWLNRLFDSSASEREARLGELAAQDADLADAVRALLAAADAADAEEAASPDGPSDPNRIGPDSLIGGRFRLLRPLGSGGMGDVFLAQRIDEIEHYVAIKILHEGGRAVSRARARREQQILAKLAHPNIAGLIDAGLTESGRPWFAMDYVDGERLIAWCDRRRSSVSDRVRRFASLCRAVQFAHKNLILHRDLKPSNILVDNEGVPKLLDFGIAKVMGANEIDETRTLALTPAYAAPEQLRGEPATTASDVYQLGSVLYELVSGVSVQQARKAAARDDETAAELPRPHQALAARVVGDRSAAEQAAQARGESPERLVRLLRSDLGRIVAKATALRPSERYDTAQAFADDLERWLAGLPVRAHRPSLAYSFGKLLRRHTWAAAAILALGLGLVLATVVAFDKAASERRQREQADAERRTAEQQRDIARSQRERSDAMVGFLRSVFQQANVDRFGTPEIAAPALLTRAVDALDRRTDVDETTRAVLLAEIGDAFTNLGQPRSGLAPAERAVAALQPQRDRHAVEFLAALLALLRIDTELGRYADAIQRATEALSLAQGTYDDERNWYAAVLAQRGFVYALQGRTAQAAADARLAIEHLDEDNRGNGEDAITALNTFAAASVLQSDYRQAANAWRRTLAIAEGDPSIGDSVTLSLKGNLASSLYHAGDNAAAIELLEPATQELETITGAASVATVMAKVTLLRCDLASGDARSARELYDQLRAVRSVVDRQSARAQGHVVDGMLSYQIAIGHFGDAAQLARGFLDAPTEAPADPRRRNDIRRLLGEAELHLGRPDAASAAFESLLSDASMRDNVAQHAALEDGIGRARLAGGDAAAAIEPLHQAAEDLRRIQGVEKPAVLRSEIHELWARALATKDPRILDRLQEKRSALVAALGGEDKLQVWQLDRLLDDLSRRLGGPGVDPERHARAEAELRRIAGSPKPPAYI